MVRYKNKIKMILGAVLLSANLFTLNVNAATPFNDAVWETMTESQKNQAIDELIEYVSDTLDINTPKVSWEDQAEHIAARYSPSRDMIIINSSVDLCGSEMADVVIHELRHAYQYKHMDDGTPETNAWKENDQNYIQAADDLVAYLSQPLEADAMAYVGGFYETHSSPSTLPFNITGLSDETDVSTSEVLDEDAESINTTSDSNDAIALAKDINEPANNVSLNLLNTSAMLQEQEIQSSDVQTISKENITDEEIAPHVMLNTEVDTTYTTNYLSKAKLSDLEQNTTVVAIADTIETIEAKSNSTPNAITGVIQNIDTAQEIASVNTFSKTLNVITSSSLFNASSVNFYTICSIFCFLIAIGFVYLSKKAQPVIKHKVGLYVDRKMIKWREQILHSENVSTKDQIAFMHKK